MFKEWLETFNFDGWKLGGYKAKVLDLVEEHKWKVKNTFKIGGFTLVWIPALIALLNAPFWIEKWKIKFWSEAWGFWDRQEEFAEELNYNPWILSKKYGKAVMIEEYTKWTWITIPGLISFSRNRNIYDEKPVSVKDINWNVVDWIWKWKSENIFLRELLHKNNIDDDLLPIIIQIINSEADLSSTFVNISRAIIDEDLYHKFDDNKKFSKSALRTKDWFNTEENFLEDLANFKIKQYWVWSVPVYIIEWFDSPKDFIKHIQSGGKINNSETSFAGGILHIKSINDFFEKNKTSPEVIRNLIINNLKNHKVSDNYLNKVINTNEKRLEFIASFYPTDTSKTLSGVFYQNLLNIWQFNDNFDKKESTKPLTIDWIVWNKTKEKWKNLGFKYSDIKKSVSNWAYNINGKESWDFIKNYEEVFNKIKEYLIYIENINNEKNKWKEIKSPLSEEEAEFYTKSMNYTMNMWFELKLSTLIAYKQFLLDDAKTCTPEPWYEFMSKENVVNSIGLIKNWDRTL